MHGSSNESDGGAGEMGKIDFGISLPYFETHVVSKDFLYFLISR